MTKGNEKYSHHITSICLCNWYYILSWPCKWVFKKHINFKSWLESTEDLGLKTGSGESLSSICHWTSYHKKGNEYVVTTVLRVHFPDSLNSCRPSYQKGCEKPLGQIDNLNVYTWLYETKQCFEQPGFHVSLSGRPSGWKNIPVWNMYSLQKNIQAVALQENHFIAGKETSVSVIYIYIFNLWIDVTFWVHKGGGNNPWHQVVTQICSIRLKQSLCTP